MSLLTIVQAAMGEVGFGVPSTVVGNADANVSQAFALANRAGAELHRDPEAAGYWPVIRKQFLFNLKGQGYYTGTLAYQSNQITNVTPVGSAPPLSGVGSNWVVQSQYLLNDTLVTGVSGTTVTLNQNSNVTQTQGSATDSFIAFGEEAYPVPSDLSYFIPDTGWDRNFRWQLLGPVNAQEWQVLKSGISPVGPRIRYRLMQGMIYLNPAPYTIGQGNPISDLIEMEYVSRFWAAPAGTVAPSQPTQSAFALDTDISMAFPEDLIVLSLKYRILKAKGMAYLDEAEEFTDALDQIAGRQTMPRNLPLNARSTGLRLLNSQNVPDTGFGT